MAVEQNPDEADYPDTCGYLLYRSGPPAQAAASLAAAIQRYEARGKIPVDVYEHQGLVNEALGERDKALVAYCRALGGPSCPKPPGNGSRRPSSG
jgi:Tfp pilus assembly protein PilF